MGKSKQSKKPARGNKGNSARNKSKTDGNKQNKGKLGDEHARLVAQLREIGMFVRKSADDGNCLFRSFADQLFGDEALHDEVRARCVEFMLANEDRFAVFVADEDQTYEEYCKEMRQDGTWGGQIELMAICQAYETHCIVHQVPDPTAGVCRTYEMRYDAHLSPYEQNFDARTLMVAYEDEVHYNSVRMDDAPNGAVHLTLRELGREAPREARRKNESGSEPNTVADNTCLPRSGRGSFVEDGGDGLKTCRATPSARRSQDEFSEQDKSDDELKVGKKLTKAERRKVKVAQRAQKEQERVERKRQKDRDAAHVRREMDSGGTPRASGLQVVVV